MVKRAGTFRSRTRHKLRKRPRDRGKVPITKLLQQFNIGDSVVVKHEPACHGGMPHPRFKGLTGIILGKRGSSYLVRVKDKGLTKILIVAPVHLQKVKVGKK
ncbi:MAG: 50S ribosomal protein L21e [Candidatus Nanoarchaeia archaeon]